MKTICNVFVPMESQEQCNRMKQLCLDNDLPIWEDEEAFEYCKKYPISAFVYCCDSDEFYIVNPYNGKKWFSHVKKITEAEFIELLNNHKQK